MNISTFPTGCFRAVAATGLPFPVTAISRVPSAASRAEGGKVMFAWRNTDAWGSNLQGTVGGEIGQAGARKLLANRDQASAGRTAVLQNADECLGRRNN